MPTHGTRRYKNGAEELFHSQYGWVSVQDFYDLLPNYNEEDELRVEPDYFARQTGESITTYHRINRDCMRDDDD